MAIKFHQGIVNMVMGFCISCSFGYFELFYLFRKNSPTVFFFVGLETFSIKSSAVNSLSSDLNSITFSLNSLVLFAMRVSMYSLLGQLSFGLFFVKSYCSAIDMQLDALLFTIFTYSKH